MHAAVSLSYFIRHFYKNVHKNDLNKALNNYYNFNV